MAILVTGGTGYLGASVVRELAASAVARGAGGAAPDDEVVLLARDVSRLGPLPGGVRAVRGDVTSIDDVATALKGCSRIVHMAAFVALFDRDPGRYRQVNVGGLRNVIRAASFGRVDRIVYTSTVLALGPSDAPGEMGDETRPAQNPVPANRYMETKAEALALAREQAAEGAPIVLLYPGIVYGPGPKREAGLMTSMLADLLAGKLPGTVGPGDRRWCHAFTADVARGHRLALERGQDGRGYVLGGPNATLTEWLATASRLAAVRPPGLRIPYALAKLAGRIEVARARLTGHAPRLTPDAVDVFRHAWAFSSARAERELGYTVTALEEGIGRTIAFLGGTGAEAAEGAPPGGHEA